jgi:hypothetical protein
MTNSSWTQAHIKSLLLKGRSSIIASLLLLDAMAAEKRAARGEETRTGGCEVVYPPCDTAELVELGRVEKRRREVVSLAQFRWLPATSEAPG